MKNTTRLAGKSEWTLIGLLSVVSVLAGCGPRSDRCAVTGSVLQAGKPVETGNIEFAPISSSQTSASGAVILAGKYTIPRETGLSPGKYRVRIFSPKPVVAKPGSPGILGLSPPEERIPAKYNVETELSVEVKANQTNEFDFDLK